MRFAYKLSNYFAVAFVLQYPSMLYNPVSYQDNTNRICWESPSLFRRKPFPPVPLISSSNKSIRTSTSAPYPVPESSHNTTRERGNLTSHHILELHAYLCLPRSFVSARHITLGPQGRFRVFVFWFGVGVFATSMRWDVGRYRLIHGCIVFNLFHEDNRLICSWVKTGLVAPHENWVWIEWGWKFPTWSRLNYFTFDHQLGSGVQPIHTNHLQFNFLHHAQHKQLIQILHNQTTTGIWSGDRPCMNDKTGGCGCVVLCLVPV